MHGGVDSHRQPHPAQPHTTTATVTPHTATATGIAASPPHTPHPYTPPNNNTTQHNTHSRLRDAREVVVIRVLRQPPEEEGPRQPIHRVLLGLDLPCRHFGI